VTPSVGSRDMEFVALAVLSLCLFCNFCRLRVGGGDIYLRCKMKYVNRESGDRGDVN
jgi:hypothetical protein